MKKNEEYIAPLSERWGKPVFNRDGGKIYLDQMNTRELEEKVKECDIVILPVGSIEAHGPFAPLGEDTIIGVSIAERIAFETGVTVAPPIFYGSHPSHHYGLRGTIPVKASTLIEYVSDVIRWLSNGGFKKILILNSHGQEYVLPIAKDVALIEKNVHALIMVTSWWSWVQDLLRKAGSEEEISKGTRLETPFIHADEAETSVIWYIAPSLIDKEILKKEEWGVVRIIPAKWVNSAGNVFPDKPFNWYDVSNPPELYHYPKGYVGWPKFADRRKGKALVDTAIKRIIEFIKWLKETYPPGVVPQTWINFKDYEYLKPSKGSELMKG